ncbi:MAG: hypothetical protein AAFW88_00975 [Pseudomonadota bacterium]
MRKSFFNWASGLVLAVFVAACASPEPVYKKSTGPRDYGFSERRLDANTFEVQFRDAPESDRAAVERFMLYRAAELTLSNGFDWFRVVNREARQGGATGLDLGGLGVGVGVVGGSSSGVGGGLSIGLPIAKDPTFVKAQIEMYAAPQPSGEADAYDARSLISSRASPS